VAATRVSELHRAAFVTGASTGLGRAFAEMLLAEGVRVWGTSRETARLAGTAAAHPGSFFPVALDLRDANAAVAAFRTAEESAGGFDLVVNNAGYGAFGGFAAADFAVWRDQLEVMLVHTAALAHAALPGMLVRGHGALVNISSLAAEFPLPFQPAYNMAKAGLSALSESLMVETRGTGVIVLDVRPGDYRTDFEGAVARLPGAEAPGARRAWAAFGKMMRSGPPPDHAAAALRRALLRHRSATVRTGRFFQAVAGPLLARLAPLALSRRIQTRYFGLD
jgi:NAD(P)-dependent dehydrogenase (short-subunit alcohol dehydrogenase family)